MGRPEVKKYKTKASEYNSKHEYIRHHLGKASYCSNPECVSVNPKRYEWALLKGKTYSKNIEDYISLCPSCHRKYDFNEVIRQKQKAKKAGELHNNAKLKSQQVVEIFHLLANGVKNVEIAKKYDLPPSSISNIKKGVNWPHMHYIYQDIISEQKAKIL